MSASALILVYLKCCCVLIGVSLIRGLFRTCKANYTYETKYITVPLDHFSFAINRTFRLRYLTNDCYWKPGGPIFFYTGNEGAVEEFAQNVGFMWETAPEFSALVVFAEHRYYGESLPFGKKSYSNRNFGYLTSTQALADFVFLASDLKKECKASNQNRSCKLIAFGGSYGGMLAAWSRLKYPAIVDGAVAASAPIYQFHGLVECNRFNDILVRTFRVCTSKVCMQNIKRTWTLLRNYTSSPEGKAMLQKALRLCKPIKNKEDLAQLLYWLTEMYANLTMLNYPYACNGLPAHPVRSFCVCTNLNKPNIGDEKLLEAYGDAICLYANYTGSTKCIDIHDITNNPSDKAWYYQSCTELVMPMCINENEMFEGSTWNFTNYVNYCYKQYGARTPRQDLPILEYGGRDVLYTRVVFTNGLLDPWHGGGVLFTRGSAVALIMPDAAHHLDLRAHHPNDPQSVLIVRRRVKHYMQCWLNDMSYT